MKLKLLTIIIIIIVLSASLWVAAQDTVAQVTLTAPVSQVNAGDTFTLTIDVAEAVGVYGGSVKLAYDPLLLAVVPMDSQVVILGDFFEAGPSVVLKNTVDASTGIIDYALTLRQPAEPVTGDGVLGRIQFEAVAKGMVQVELAEAQLLAPVFEQVNGRQIASQVNEMPVQIQSLTLAVADTTESDVPPFVEHSTTIRPAQPITPVLVQSGPAVSPVLMLGMTFFLLGLGMFVFSLLTYTRLRRFSGA